MNDIARPDYESMPIGKLREYASHMQIALAKTATKEEIKEAIYRKQAGRAGPILASKGDKVPPGHSLIIINEDANPGAKNFPIPFNINNYTCTVPRGKEVIVPNRVVRILRDATVKRLVQKTVQDQYGREVYQNAVVTVPSYSFQVLESAPGPEPLTPLEQQKQKTMGPRKRYRQMFGRYPRPAELVRAIEKGFIKLDQEEELAGVEAMMVTKEETANNEQE
jgi:hypothetical protein